jgi:Family of unknown function (DUF6600)/FecR protein
VGSHFPSALWSLALPTLLIGLSPAFASAPGDACEPKGATFARVRFVETVLTHERAGEGEVQQVPVNFPVAGGDIVGTSEGRAEIELADSSRVFLDNATRVGFRSLGDASHSIGRVTVLVLARGAVRLDVDAPATLEGRFAIETAAGSIDLLSAGSFLVGYRDGVTTLSTFHGAAELSGDEGSVLLRSGQRSVCRRKGAPSEPLRWNAQGADAFGLFRDQQMSDTAGLEVDVVTEEEPLPEPVRPFAAELASYGGWSSLPEFGRVWRPAYAGAWSPYSRGYWSWRPIGWVWISADPWGWAPYHYGRWEYEATQGWFWIPGSVWGGSWVAFAVGPSQIGWCPLDYWNRPVVHEHPDSSRIVMTAGVLDVRGWRFVAADQFAQHDPAGRSLRSDHLSRSTPVAITGTLPPMNRSSMVMPGAAVAWLDQARGALTALPMPGSSGGQLRSFRSLEPGLPPARPRAPGRPDVGAAAQGFAPRPDVARSPWTSVAPAHPGPGPSSTSGSLKGPAVGRLIGGTRPPGAPPPPPATRPGDRQDGIAHIAPRPKTPLRPIPPPDDSPPPSADSQHDQ